ncbi:MAG: leucine-rich repeat protein, partial [Ruminococcus sp.]|nr:leucine-rich repeat protein [Ruminococcus sp.]
MIIMDHDRLCEYTTADEFVVISGEFRIIGKRAFAHGRMPVRFVVIPPSVTEIEDRAFYDCNNMLSIVIPGSVKKIGNKAFGYGIDGKVESFHIFGEKGSEAEHYAAENGFAFFPLHENAPSFDDFTLSYYQTKRVNNDLYSQISFHYPLTVPNIHEEAARLLNVALEMYQTDYPGAIERLKQARRIYLTMHATDEQIFRLEPEPPHLPGQDEAIYHYAEIEHFICNSEGCSAASRGDWHTAYDCFKTAYLDMWLYHKPKDDTDLHIKWMLFKALGLTSLMLQNPAEALYRYQQELEALRELRPVEKYYGEYSECFKRIGDALLFYGYLDAVEYFCERSMRMHRANMEYREKTANDTDSKAYLDLSSPAYDEYRLALLYEDSWRMRYACNLLKECRDKAPWQVEKKEEGTADIRRMKEIALKSAGTSGE